MIDDARVERAYKAAKKTVLRELGKTYSADVESLLIIADVRSEVLLAKYNLGSRPQIAERACEYVEKRELRRKRKRAREFKELIVRRKAERKALA